MYFHVVDVLDGETLHLYLAYKQSAESDSVIIPY